MAWADSAGRVLSERAYEMCNLPLPVRWQVPFKGHAVLWLPATELIGVEVVWAVVLNAAA